MNTRHACSVLMAVLVVSAPGMFAHGQAAGGVRIVEGDPASSVGPPMSEVYQSIFSPPLAPRGVSSFPSGPDDDASWAKWPAEEVRQNVQAFFRQIGLDSNAAAILFLHARDAIARQTRYTQRTVAQLCERKAGIQSKAQLAQAFGDLYGELDRMQQNDWGSFDMLDAGNRARLAAFAAQRREGMQMYPTDLATISRDFERSPETLGQMLARICQGK